MKPLSALRITAPLLWICPPELVEGGLEARLILSNFRIFYMQKYRDICIIKCNENEFTGTD